MLRTPALLFALLAAACSERETPGFDLVRAEQDRSRPLPTEDLDRIARAPAPVPSPQDPETPEWAEHALAAVFAGRVVDRAGAPLADRAVTLFERAAEGDVDRVSPAGLRGATSRTDDAGRYRVLGLFETDSLAGRRFELGVEVRGADADQRFAVGPDEADRVLVVDEAGVVEIDPADLPLPVRSLLALRLARAGTVGDAIALHGIRGPRRARVPGGTYDLEFVFDGRVLGRHEGLRVRAGERCSDPRIAPLQLPSGVELREVRVVGPDGERLGDARVRYRTTRRRWNSAEPHWKPARPAQTDEGLLLWVRAGAPPLRVAVSAPGHAAVEVTDAASGAVVQLARNEEVELLLPGAPPEPGATVELRPVDAEQPSGELPPARTVGEDRRLRFELAAGQSYLARIRDPRGHVVEYSFGVWAGESTAELVPTGAPRRRRRIKHEVR